MSESIKDFKFGGYDTIKHQELVDSVINVKAGLQDINEELVNYKKDIQITIANMQQTISTTLESDMSGYTIDGILDIVEVRQIEKDVDTIKSQLKQIVDEAKELLSQKYTDGSILIDDKNYILNRYKYKPADAEKLTLERLYVDTAGPKSVLETYYKQLYLDYSVSGYKIEDTIWYHFEKCAKLLISTDTDLTTSGLIEIDKDLLIKYYSLLDTLNTHIEDFNKIIIIARKRIQEVYDEKQRKQIDDTKAQLTNEFKEAAGALSDAMESLDTFKDDITKSLQDGILDQLEIDRIQQLRTQLQHQVRQARDEADDILNAKYIDEDGAEVGDDNGLIDDSPNYRFPAFTKDESNLLNSVLTWKPYAKGERIVNGVDQSAAWGIKTALEKTVELLCELNKDNEIVVNNKTIWTNFYNAVERLCTLDVDNDPTNGVQISEMCKENYLTMYEQLLSLLTFLSEIVNSARVRMSEVYSIKQSSRTDNALTTLTNSIHNEIAEASTAISKLTTITDSLQNNITNSVADGLLDYVEVAAIQAQRDQLNLQVLQMKDEVDDLLSQVYVDNTSLLVDGAKDYFEYVCTENNNFALYVPNMAIVKNKVSEEKTLGIRSALYNALELLYDDDPATYNIWNQYDLTISSLIQKDDDSSIKKVDRQVLEMYYANASIFNEHMQYINELVIKSSASIQAAYDKHQLDALGQVNQYIADLGNDNVLDHIEKASMRNNLIDLSTNHSKAQTEFNTLASKIKSADTSISNRFTFSDVSTIENTKYNALIDYLTNTLEVYVNTDTSIDDMTAYTSAFTQYYVAKSDLDSSISDLKSQYEAISATVSLQSQMALDLSTLRTTLSQEWLADIEKQVDGRKDAYNGTYYPTLYNEPAVSWLRDKPADVLDSSIYEAHLSDTYTIVLSESLQINDENIWSLGSPNTANKAWFNDNVTGTNTIYTNIPIEIRETTTISVQPQYNGNYKFGVYEFDNKFNLVSSTPIKDINGSECVITITNQPKYIGIIIQTTSNGSITLETGHQVLGSSKDVFNACYQYSWRFLNENSQWGWVKIANSDAAKALQDAAKALAAADGKMSVFSGPDTPKGPYQKGDLWVQGESGDILYATEDVTIKDYQNINHWVSASKYTDDSSLNKFSGIVNASINALDSSIKQYKEDNDQLQSKIDAAKSIIDEMAADDILSSVEKTSLRAIFIDISTNHYSDQFLARTYDISTNDDVYANEDTAFTNLSNYIINDLSLYSNTSSAINKTTYDASFNAYYIANASLDASITEAKARKEALATKTELLTRINAIDNSNNLLQSSIDRAMFSITAMGEDDKITPTEKKSLNTLFNQIATNHYIDVSIAEMLQIPTSNASVDAENNAFIDLSTYLYNDVSLADTSIVTTVDKSEYNNKFTTYYTANKNLDSLIVATKAFIEASALTSELYGEIDGIVQSNASLQDKINEATNLIIDLADDSKITGSEKIMIRTYWNDLSTNHYTDVYLATLYKITEEQVYANENTAFNNLSTYMLDTLQIDSSTTVDVSLGQYNSIINAYTVANKNLDSSIMEAKAKAEAEQVKKELNDTINSTKDSLKKEWTQDIQDQIDGQKSGYFYNWFPTLYNEPVSEWINGKTDPTEILGIYKEHSMDTFTNVQTQEIDINNRDLWSVGSPQVAHNTWFNAPISDKAGEAYTNLILKANQNITIQISQNYDGCHFDIYELTPSGDLVNTNPLCSNAQSYQIAEGTLFGIIVHEDSDGHLPTNTDIFESVNVYNACYQYSWRFINEGGGNTFGWVRITDSDAAEALAKASLAQAAADGKMKVFYGTNPKPQPPYQIGDIWLEESGGEVRYAIVNKLESESFNTSDWVTAKYTDDSSLNSFSVAVNTSINAINSSIQQYKADNDRLQASINMTKAAIDDMASDSVITPVEKKTLRTLFNNISTNHYADQRLARIYDISTNASVYTNENAAFIDLSNYILDTLGINNNVSSLITKSVYDSKFNTYYVANASLDASITEAKAKLEVSTANASLIDRINEIDASNGALQISIAQAITTVAQFSDDSYITTAEKRFLINTINDISINHAADQELAELLKISDGDEYKDESTAFDALINYVDKTLQIYETNVITQIDDKDSYEKAFNTYYEANKALDTCINYQRVLMETENLSTNIYADLKKVADDNSTLQTKIDNVDSSIKDMSADNKITAAEKTALRTYWNDISTNHKIDVQLAEDYGIVADAPVRKAELIAFNALDTYLNKTIHISENTTEPISADTFNSTREAYTKANKNLDASINAMKALIEANLAIDGISIGTINLLDYSSGEYCGNDGNNTIYAYDNNAGTDLADDEGDIYKVTSKDSGYITVVKNGESEKYLDAGVLINTKTVDKLANVWYTISFDAWADNDVEIAAVLINDKIKNDEITSFDDVKEYVINVSPKISRYSYSDKNGLADTPIMYWIFVKEDNQPIYIKNIKIEVGNIATGYSKSQNDIDREMAEKIQRQIESGGQADLYLNDAIEKLETEVKGGLVLSSIIELRNSESNITAGLSGLYYVKNANGKYIQSDGTTSNVINNSTLKDDNLLWSGGSYNDVWAAQKGEKILPVRITKSGIGSNIGPFIIDSSKSISIKKNDGSILIDADGNINIYGSQNKLKIGIHQNAYQESDYKFTQKYYSSPQLYDFIYDSYTSIVNSGYYRCLSDASNSFTVPLDCSVGDYIYSYTPKNSFTLSLCTPFAEFFDTLNPSEVSQTDLHLIDYDSMMNLTVVGAYDVLIDETSIGSNNLNNFSTTAGIRGMTSTSNTFNNAIKYIINNPNNITRLLMYIKNDCRPSGLTPPRDTTIPIIKNTHLNSQVTVACYAPNNNDITNLQYYKWIPKTYKTTRDFPAKPIGSSLTSNPIDFSAFSGVTSYDMNDISTHAFYATKTVNMGTLVNPDYITVPDCQTTNIDKNPNLTLYDEAVLCPSTAVLQYNTKVTLSSPNSANQDSIGATIIEQNDNFYMYNDVFTKYNNPVTFDLIPGHTYRRAWGICVSTYYNSSISTPLVWSNDFQIDSDGVFMKSDLTNSINIYSNGLLSIGKDMGSMVRINTDGNESGTTQVYINGLPTIKDIQNLVTNVSTSGKPMIKKSLKNVSVGLQPGMLYLDGDNLKVFASSQISKPFVNKKF